jgi:hypothetical protein
MFLARIFTAGPGHLAAFSAHSAAPWIEAAIKAYGTLDDRCGQND